MRLPEAKHAVVDEAKVRDYLLSPEHPVGRFKARVFNAVGYRRENWQQLQRDVLAVAQTMDVELTETTEFGERYVGTTMLLGPSGAPLPIVAVWIIRSGEPPHFVTAYPSTER